MNGTNSGMDLSSQIPTPLLKSNIPYDFPYYTDLPKSHSNNRDTPKSRSISKTSVTACQYPRLSTFHATTVPLYELLA